MILKTDRGAEYEISDLLFDRNGNSFMVNVPKAKLFGETAMDLDDVGIFSTLDPETDEYHQYSDYSRLTTLIDQGSFYMAVLERGES